MVLNLRDYGFLGTDTPATITSVGIPSDLYLRGMYPVLGDNRILTVTETGAHLDDLDTGTVNRLRITNRVSQTGSFSELGETWASEACSAPVFHVNVNLLDDGRENAFGWLVVRRTVDVTIVDEDRGPQGIQTRTYAHWNVHFDPIDLSAPGPIVGEFHWKRDSGEYTPDEYERQEITFLDGCSTNVYDKSKETGYLIGNRSTLTPRPRNPFGDCFLSNKYGIDPTLNNANRFWDSYVVLRVMIDLKQFWDWRRVDRSSWVPTPEYKGAYLIFANGGSRGNLLETSSHAPDPPMKLVRVHYVGTMAEVSDPPIDATLLGGQIGSRFLDDIQFDKLPVGIPFTPELDLGVGGNYLYSDISTTTDPEWRVATQSDGDQERLNIHGQWPSAIYHTSDKFDIDSTRIPTTDYAKVPLRGIDQIRGDDNLLQTRLLGYNGFRDQDWGVQIVTTPVHDRRRDMLGGMVSHRFFEVIETTSTTRTPFARLPPGQRQWVPGWFIGAESDLATWDSTDIGARAVRTEERNSEIFPSTFRQFVTSIRAIAAPDHNDDIYYYPYIYPIVGEVDDFDEIPIDPVWVSFNSIRGWEDRRLIHSTSKEDSLNRSAQLRVLNPFYSDTYTVNPITFKNSFAPLYRYPFSPLEWLLSFDIQTTVAGGP